MTVNDIIKLGNDIQLYSAIVNNFISKDENVPKPVISIKNIANNDIDIDNKAIIYATMMAISETLDSKKKHYSIIDKKLFELFELNINDLIERYSKEENINIFLNTLENSKKKDNGAGLTIAISEDRKLENGQPDISICNIDIDDISEKIRVYIDITSILEYKKSKIQTDNYLKAIDWINNTKLSDLVSKESENNTDSKNPHVPL